MFVIRDLRSKTIAGLSGHALPLR